MAYGNDTLDCRERKLTLVDIAQSRLDWPGAGRGRDHRQRQSSQTIFLSCLDWSLYGFRRTLSGGIERVPSGCLPCQNTVKVSNTRQRCRHPLALRAGENGEALAPQWCASTRCWNSRKSHLRNYLQRPRGSRGILPHL